MRKSKENPIQFLHRVCEAVGMINQVSDTEIVVSLQGGLIEVDFPAPDKYGKITIDAGKLIGMSLDETVAELSRLVDKRFAFRKAEERKLKEFRL